MGWITTLTLNNDLVHILPKYPNLGEEIHSAVSQIPIESPVSIPRAGITVIESHHADFAELIMVGGRHEGKELGPSAWFNVEDPELELLQQFADKLGYSLRKKPK